ncbi:MgtC/SapB family protein [Aggregicoccus sp. 17bor-14]|uniref:MgtC/SapB family protein n=1 Tax=Myxococcaceae TaxID=31 RepID=UPI00129CD514|nr:MULTISPECIES: MgtC/SapB family protein [Myxococcaceae]MBF5045696.1 MgtC/SapB family protein [Simulacricoccus sp. 17bor-14]MRI91433.1 MgtC/SapB family protein [Aggregicoccus sp. 17bor-14]
MLSHLDMLVRISVGAVLGAAIGYERNRHRRPVGLRTHLLVSMASATFMVISSQFAFFQGFGTEHLVEVDASRIAASVVSAVGFLAGGAILRTGATVQGLTTAAGLWLVTAIGLSSGAGMYPEACFVTLLGLIALTFLRRFEDKNDALIRRRVALVLTAGTGIHAVTEMLRALGVRVLDVEYERHFSGERHTTLNLDAQIPASVTPDKLVEGLETTSGVVSVHVRSA